MSRRSWTAALAAAVLLTTAAPAAANTAEPSGLRAKLDAVVTGGPTGALLEVRDGARTVRLGAGTARSGTVRPVDPRGSFRAGSVTKMVVATTVLQLVAERRLGLDDLVDRRLPGVLPPGNGVRVRQLLDHTSGLYDYTWTLPLNPPSAFEPLRWKTWTPRELVDRAIAKQPVPAPVPGAAYGYSSTGYLLLGMIIERVTGRPYAKEISRRILRPLHLRGTVLPGVDPRMPDPHARAYLPGEKGVIDITEYNPSVMGASGELVTTAADLNRFTTALLAGRLLRPAELGVMKKIVHPSTRGLGLEVLPLPCGTAWGHSGDALGASAWTFATDAEHAVTLSVTWGTGRPDKAAVSALLTAALCR